MSFVRSLVQFYAKHGRLLLALAVVMTVLAGVSASRLSLDADLERLLPESARSVQGMESLKTAYGPIGRLTLVLEGDDEAKLQAAARQLGKGLRTFEDVDRTEYQRPIDFFEDNRLLYVELDDLKTAAKRIKKRIRWEKKQANPLFVSVKKTEPPSVDLSDIEEKYDAIGGDRYFKSEDGHRHLVFIYFDFPPSKLAMSAAAIDKITTWATQELQAYPGVTFQFTGRYKKRIDQTGMLEKDLASATVVALVLLMLFLLGYYRSVLIPVLVVVPLLIGTLWAFAYAQLVFGSLNILTGFLGAVILGLGIDYGIHIMSRYLEARSEGHDCLTAIATTLNSAGRASMYAGITTVVAFGSLAVSHFRAFHEYGIIALGGMTLIIVAIVVVLPVLLILVDGTPFEPRAKPSILPRVHATPTLRRALAGALAALCVLAAVGIGDTAFEYDFRQVFSTDLPSWTLDEEVDELLELPQIPSVVLADSPEHAAAIRDEVNRRMTEIPEGKTIKSVMTIRDLMPKEQEPKFEVLRDLAKEFGKLPKRVRAKEKELVAFDEEIAKVIAQGSVTLDTLPDSLAKPFRRIDSEDAEVVLIFPAIELHDAREMGEFAVVIRGLPAGASGEPVDAISEALLMVDILEFVRVDGVFMLSITIFGLLLCSIVAFRRIRRVAILVGTLSTAMFVALGLVALFDVQFNFINVLILPIWLGLGVDAAFHLMIRAEESADIMGFLETASAVFAAFATSMIGFGAMLITNHAGLASLGWAAVVGLGSILAVSILFQAVMFSDMFSKTE